MSNVRVTYSGLVSLAIGIVALLTGLAFTLIITRSVTPEEYGTWSVIGSLVSYFLIGDSVVAFWAVRQIARGEIIGKTATVSSLSISIILIPLYILFAKFVSGQSNADFAILAFSSILIPFYFVNQVLNSINQGHQPHYVSYALIIFELIKIPTALYFVYFAELGVLGIIYAILIAFIVRIIFQIYLSRNYIKDNLQLSQVKRWFRLSWIPLYSSLTNVYLPLDIVLFPMLVGNVAGVALYQISYVISAIILKAGIVSSSLYPKLLAKGTNDHIKENFNLLLYFSILFTGISIIFAKPFLFAFNPVYVDASVVVVLLAFKMFFMTMNRTCFIILQGTESVDIEKSPSFAKLKQSKLFFVPTARNIQFISYMSTLGLVFLYFMADSSSLELVTMWAVLSLSFELPLLVYLIYYLKRTTEFSFPYTNVVKYLSAVIGFSLVFILTSDFILIYENRIFYFLPRLILQLALCIAVYFGITYAIDQKTRTLTKAIIYELRTKVRI